MNHIITKMEKY